MLPNTPRARVLAALGISLAASVVVTLLLLGAGSDDSAATSARTTPLGAVTRPEAVPAPPPPAPDAIAASLAWGAGGTLGRGETLASALRQHGLDGQAVHEVVTALGPLCDFRRLPPQVEYDLCLQTDDGQIRSLSLRPDPLTTLCLLRGEDGRFAASRHDVPISVAEARVEATIRTSLYQAIEDAGESPALATRIADVFAWDLDFTRDQHPGDTFRMIVEKRQTADGLVGYGRILAAEYVGARGSHRAFWYSPDGSEKRGHFYLEDGQSAEKTMLATPLQYTRVSSRFDRHRKHPILGYTRAHNGTDFAASRGTPVRSMAEGRVTFAGRKGGNGNLVVVEHAQGLSTHYAHLDRIASGLRRGTRVQQKTLLGTVGSTGLATGPHLHLGMKRNGKWIDPQSVKARRSEPVPAGHRDAFRDVVALRRAGLAASPTAPLQVAHFAQRYLDASGF